MCWASFGKSFWSIVYTTHPMMGLHLPWSTIQMLSWPSFAIIRIYHSPFGAYKVSTVRSFQCLGLSSIRLLDLFKIFGHYWSNPAQLHSPSSHLALQAGSKYISYPLVHFRSIQCYDWNNGSRKEKGLCHQLLIQEHFPKMIIWTRFVIIYIAQIFTKSIPRFNWCNTDG